MPGSLHDRRQAARQLVKRSGVNRMRWVHKARIVRSYGLRIGDCLTYVLFDPEAENFTYEIENGGELAAWLDDILGAGRYVAELDRDSELAHDLRKRLRWRPANKRRAMFGRRAGWYAIARALRPARIVETGIHDGLGSVALLAALDKNGFGELVSIDPKPGAGWLVPDRLRPRWRPVRGTSFDMLPSAGPIDLFIHDSLHTPECERWELETAARLGSSVLVSDNAHAASTCSEFARSREATFSFWRERVRGHFYPGGGIGVVVLDGHGSVDLGASS